MKKKILISLVAVFAFICAVVAVVLVLNKDRFPFLNPPIKLVNQSQFSELHFNTKNYQFLTQIDKFSRLEEQLPNQLIYLTHDPIQNPVMSFSGENGVDSSVYFEKNEDVLTVIVYIPSDRGLAEALEVYNRNYLIALYSYLNRPSMNSGQNLEMLNRITDIIFSNPDQPFYIIE